MKTLNYIKLNESGVANVVSALHQLLADFQVYYTNLLRFPLEHQGTWFHSYCTRSLKVCMTTQPRRWTKLQNVSWCWVVYPKTSSANTWKVAKIKEVSDVACGSDAISNILETYGYLIGEERKIIELANEAGDDVTADLMTGYLKEQEKNVWMLVAFSTKGCTDK